MYGKTKSITWENKRGRGQGPAGRKVKKIRKVRSKRPQKKRLGSGNGDGGELEG